ncbi:DNA repair protein RecN [Borrelia persica]|uniref:DNA recombination protein RecN n=1 Tax=Borrelia persica TaxID=44448 RepID=UPI0004679B28|nr:DNA recombination protein RecN [Borrelia persica]
MLIELFIKNFILIKEVSIRLNMGLVALTGESGSGKSLLLSSLYYLFGGKIKNNIITDGERRGVLLAKFKANDDVRDYLYLKGILVEDFIIIKRVIIFESFNVILSNYYINDEPISNSVLKPLFNMLIEVHSPSQEYWIFQNPLNNLKILDHYANLGVKLEAYKLEYESYIAYLNDYDGFVLKQKLHNDNREKCESIINEIDFVSPKVNEDEILNIKLNELKSCKAICSSLLNLRSVLSLDNSVSALSEIKEVIYDAEYLAGINASYFELENRLRNSCYELEDVGQAYSRCFFERVYDEGEHELIEARLYSLSRLKRKYGPSLGDVIALRKRCSEIINLSFDFEAEKLAIEQKLNSLFKNLEKLAFDISDIRKTAALKFGSEVTAVLHKLNMSNAKFFVSISEGKMKPTGIDDVKFLISSNIGLKAQPIYKVAYGGEISRIILAIKSIQNTDDNKLIIFDEIDSGIGGESGVSLGKYLKDLSKDMQIFVVTRLANIASLSDFHILVKKEWIKEKTYVQASLLLGDKRALEIARMLSGHINDISFRHAEELLKSNN